MVEIDVIEFFRVHHVLISSWEEVVALRRAVFLLLLMTARAH